MRSKIRNRKSEIAGAAPDVALARRLLTEVLADEARDIGWGPDVTNLGKLRDALAALGREVPKPNLRHAMRGPR